MITNLTIISFTSCAYSAVSKKLSKYQRSPRFSPMFSSRSFIILHFTFRFVIQSELIFMKGEVVLIDFFFFACGCLVVSTSFVKKLTFSPLDCLCCYLKDQAVSNIYIYIYISVTTIMTFTCLLGAGQMELYIQNTSKYSVSM